MTSQLVYGGPGVVDVVEVADHPPGEGELALRPRAVSMCFSDVHLVRGLWEADAVGTPLGHEGVAVVDEVGARVTGWAVGDVAVYEPTYGCGNCDLCRGGLRRACPGGRGPLRAWGLFSERIVTPAHRWRRVPSDLDVIAAANTEPFAVGTRHARHSGVVAGDHVAFFGLDDYAMSAMQWVRRTAGNLVVIDPSAHRRSTALALGADEVIDPGIEDVAAELARSAPFGVDVSFISVEDYVPESMAYLASSVQATRLQGRIVLTRIYTERGFEGFPAMEFWGKELQLVGYGLCWADENWRGGEDRGDFRLTVDALHDGWLDASSMVSVRNWKDVLLDPDRARMFLDAPELHAKIQVHFPA